MRLMASVSGIRGIVGETLTPSVAVDAGCALAAFVGGTGSIVVGRDSRTSGEMVNAGVIAGLLAGGCQVVDVGVCTTPGAALMVRKHRAAGGVMITASHNPLPWNGIKFLGADAAAPPHATAEQILERFLRREARPVPADRVGRLTHDGSTNEHHVQSVLGVIGIDAIQRHRFKVVLDSVNGGGGPAGRQLLEALGCQLIHLNAEPTGRFAHTPEPIAENLTDLARRTREARADVGFAQDPDADRLAIVDDTGRYIGEEYTLVLAAKRVFGTRPGPACTNLSTSRMIEDVAAQFPGCTVYRSAVGEANVVEMMKRHNCVIGGEGNGGVIDPRVVHVRDSLVSMALVLELMAVEGEPLSQIVDALPRYVTVKEKFECGTERIATILSAVRKTFAGEKISELDGIRIDWPDGWVHIRGSNTEPIMRIIAEADDAATANGLIARVWRVADATR